MRRQRVRPSERARHPWVEYALAHPVALTFAVAFVVRALVAIVIFILRGGVIFVDEAMYATMAKLAADGQTQNWDSYTRGLYRDTATFLVPLTLIFKLAPVVLLGQLFVSALGAAAAALTERLASEVVRRPWSLAAGAVVALMPSQVFFTTLTLKDGTVWACGAAIALTIARAGRAEGSRFWWLIGGGAVLLMLMAHTRAHTFVAACWAAGIALFVGAVSKRGRAALVGLGVLILLPLLGGQGVGGLHLVTNHGSLETRRALNAENAATAFVPDDIPGTAAAAPAGTDGPTPSASVPGDRPTTGVDAAAHRAAERAAALEAAAAADQARAEALQRAGEAREAGRATVTAEIARLRAERARARADRLSETTSTTAGTGIGTAFSEEGDDASSSASRNLRHLPKGLSAILLQPYPWRNPTNPRVQLARGETLLWYPLLGLALVGVVALRRHARVLLFPLLLSGAMALVYGLTEGNFGTAYRHRGELVWTVALLAAVGASEVARRLSRDPIAYERLDP